MIGKTISHYKIISKLGEGGMGVVYKAQDTKLDREVALKFLPAKSIATDEEKKRFEQEAKAAAKLSHANIATVHAIDEVDGQTFIAMEYVDGETLGDMVSKRPLKIKDAIKIAKQIAEGLHTAHEQGVVHRDIKSANIMITARGVVKIMDFGLAKLSKASMVTKAGTTVGTISYMSPEQTQGERVDHRSDIWSLGVVLYEMVSGQLPFKGDYESAIIYSIMNEDPEPLTAVRTGVPMKLEEIVNKLLAKDVAERYQNIVELPVDLANIELSAAASSAVSTDAHAPIAKKPRQWTRMIPWLGIVSIVLIASVLVYVWESEPSIQQTAKFSHIVLPEAAPLDPIGSATYRIGQPAIAISKDGKNLVYVGNRSGETQLFLRPMDGFEVTPIQGTEGAVNPFFSPDGQWIGFFSGQDLKKVSINGGTPIVLREAIAPTGACWGKNAEIIFTQMEGQTLIRISEDGSLIHKIGMNSVILWPEILPGGKVILATSMWPHGIKAIFLETGEERFIIEGRYFSPRYLPNGQLLFERDGRLEAVDFDINTLQVTGLSVPVLDNIRVEGGFRAAQYAISDDGTLTYIPGGFQGNGELVWVDRQGKEGALPFPVDEYLTYQLSPDDRQLAIGVKDDVWIFDMNTGMRTKLTLEGNNWEPRWTPDGEWVTFSSDRTGYHNIFMKHVSTGEVKQLTKNTSEDKLAWSGSWSPDGKILAYNEVTLGNSDILLLKQENGEQAQQFITTESSEWAPVFSPGGLHIAYYSDEQGQFNVYVESHPHRGKKKRISTESGHEPIWSPGSQELLYWTYDIQGIKWMAVPYETGPDFKSGSPKEIFSGDYLDILGIGWDVSSDGQRLLLLKPTEEFDKKYSQINLITNWFEELDRKAQGSE